MKEDQADDEWTEFGAAGDPNKCPLPRRAPVTRPLKPRQSAALERALARIDKAYDTRTPDRR